MRLNWICVFTSTRGTKSRGKRRSRRRRETACKGEAAGMTEGRERETEPVMSVPECESGRRVAQ